jgi:hypothetical protein
MMNSWLSNPEAFSSDYEEYQALLRQLAQEAVAISLIALLLEVGIAKLNVEMAERGEDFEPDAYEPDESMDGDFDSAMASAGMGTDEDYNHYDYSDEGY